MSLWYNTLFKKSTRKCPSHFPAFEQSQKEVEDLRQRTREGMKTAKMNGRQIGQKPGAKLHIKKADAAKKAIQIYSKDFLGGIVG